MIHPHFQLCQPLFLAWFTDSPFGKECKWNLRADFKKTIYKYKIWNFIKTILEQDYFSKGILKSSRRFNLKLILSSFIWVQWYVSRSTKCRRDQRLLNYLWESRGSVGCQQQQQNYVILKNSWANVGHRDWVHRTTSTLFSKLVARGDTTTTKWQSL